MVERRRTWGLCREIVCWEGLLWILLHVSEGWFSFRVRQQFHWPRSGVHCQSGGARANNTHMSHLVLYTAVHNTVLYTPVSLHYPGFSWWLQSDTTTRSELSWIYRNLKYLVRLHQSDAEMTLYRENIFYKSDKNTVNIFNKGSKTKNFNYLYWREEISKI